MDLVLGFFRNAVEFVNNSSLDFIIIAGTFFVLVFFGFQFGKDKIISLILSLYITLLIYLNFPYLDLFILDGMELISNIGVFVVFLFLINMILKRMILSEYPHDLMHKWFEIIVLSLVATTLLLAFIYHVLPVFAVHDFSPDVDKYFATSELFFWWLVAPFVAMFFVIRR